MWIIEIYSQEILSCETRSTAKKTYPYQSDNSWKIQPPASVFLMS